MRKRKAFTLLELLVAVAIIGLLAALLFPVFAAERATLRDTKCLANVKAIAVAIRMYATDYEELWPGERSERVREYFSNSRDAAGPGNAPGVCTRTRTANPYLRPAVILDDYLKNRQVWQCPRATMVNRAVYIVPPGTGGDWLQSYRDHQGQWGQRRRHRGERAGAPAARPVPSAPWVSLPGEAFEETRARVVGPCLSAFPAGWGGAITDSFLQGAFGGHVPANAPVTEPPAFVQAIATNSNLADLKLSRVGDPAKYLVCGDCSTEFEASDITGVAFPDTCATKACGYKAGEDGCGNTCNFADWQNCPWTRACGLTPVAHERLLTDAEYRRFLTRHRGGSNVGFLDGHAKWYASEFLLKHSEPFKYRAFEGHLCSCWPGNGKVSEDAGQHTGKGKPTTEKPLPRTQTKEGGR
jgi:prepilin-type N-terminal cleavage/methylation domain-containing protein/prepilin-type processing-associated H-X9-DG protein